MLGWFAALLWVALGVSIFELVRGNPTAINGVIGAGIGAVLFTVLALLDR